MSFSLIKSPRAQLSASVFLFVTVILGMVQLKVDSPMLLFERLFKHGGWLEIIILSVYGAILAWNMFDIYKSPRWRLLSWQIFSAWFFLQLFIGIFLSDVFLLTGKLHLPVPSMIIAGPLYRWQISFMTLLFLSTLLLSGSAWCSQLCYFGAIDAAISKKGKLKPSAYQPNITVKITILIFVALCAILLRQLGIPALYSTIIGLCFGLGGLAIILFISRKKGSMIHCTVYCPVGTVVNLLGKISPFRFKIDQSCTNCMACTTKCRYNALTRQSIIDKKPGVTCTLCGDCQVACHTNSFHYSFLGLSPNKSRWAYLFISISLHAIFMGMGRI